MADRFLKIITEPEWDNDRALEEAGDLGPISPVMKTFALDYIKAHKK